MVRLESVSVTYRKTGAEVRALDRVDFAASDGEFVAVRGPSGSGKSSLLLSIGAMVRPTEGRVFLDGRDLYALSARERARIRGAEIGFVFQLFYLVPYLNVLENVLLGQLAVRNGSARKEALDLIERFGLAGRVRHRPAELSVGERQRVAVARALLSRPRLILADEPTGNLDPDNGAQIMGILAEFHRAGGTVILVTHESYPVQYAQRSVVIRGGRIEPARNGA